MSYSSVVLADTPIAYFKMNELSGNTAHDSTSNHYDATLSGTFTLGQSGAIIGSTDTSILFDGTTGMLSLPCQLNYTTFSAISIEFWINIDTSWQHVVMTCDNTTTLVYVNTVLTTPVSTASIEVSSIFDFVGSYQNAHIAQFALYNYVLSPAAIGIHYANGGVHFVLFPPISRRTGVFDIVKRRIGNFFAISRRTGAFSMTKRRIGVMPTAMRRTGIFSSAKRRTGLFAGMSRRTGTFLATRRRQTE